MATSKKKTSTDTAVNQAVEESSVLNAIAPPKQMENFLTEKNSSFEDGYSIAKEEKFLFDIYEGDVPEDSIHYDRFIELHERIEQLKVMSNEFSERKGAEPVIKDSEVRAMDKLGALVDSDEDLMIIHTKEAYRMFMGRGRSPENRVPPIVGGRTTASALRNLWNLTANDNPYADWALLRHEQSIAEIQKRLSNEVKAGQAALEAQKEMGLVYFVLKSEHPHAVPLGFRSPYGYTISRLIVEFDYFIRLQKTLARKTLRSDMETRQTIAEITRYIRRVFHETGRFDTWLGQRQLLSLCRMDFIKELQGQRPGADKRVEAVTEIFGTCPKDVFTAKLQPRHTRRRADIHDAEMALLQKAGVKPANKEKAAAGNAESVNDPEAGLL